MAFNYDLKPIKNKEQLLTFLGIDEWIFDQVLAFDPDQYDRAIKSGDIGSFQSLLFFKHLIPKRDRNKGKRVVWEASSLVDREYKATSRRLEAFFSFAEGRYPHPNAYGYIRGRNTRQNAMRHLNKKNILKCDVRDFFGSVDLRAVARVLEKYDIEHNVAGLLANFLTIGKKLPLGLATSPIITNIICLELDDELTALARSYKAEYTRYADDLTFSGNGELPDAGDVAKVVQAHGFQLAENKTRKTKLGQSHYVTGLSVSDPKFPHAPRKLKRSLRQELHYAKRFGLDDHLSSIGINDFLMQQRAINRIDGMVKYVAHHEPKMAHALHSLWTEILEEEGVRPSFEPKNRHRAAVHIFGDETEFEFQDRTYLALGLCVTRHVDRIAISASTTLSNHLADPLADGDLEKIRKNGLHFSDATEDLRKKFVSNMQKLPFTGYVAIASFSDCETYEETYLRLLRSLIRRRLIASDGLVAAFRLEATDKVSKKSISALIEEEFKKLEAEDNRRPSQYLLETVSKADLGIALPDFLLGVLRRYLVLKPRKKVDRVERAEILFEHLRDKLVVLLDLDNASEYSRRNPVRPWFERVTK